MNGVMCLMQDGAVVNCELRDAWHKKLSGTNRRLDFGCAMTV